MGTLLCGKSVRRSGFTQVAPAAKEAKSKSLAPQMIG